MLRRGDDDTPIAWWEWLFLPFVMVGTALFLIALMLWALPFFELYPDLHFTDYDEGTERQQETIRRYRRFTSRVSFWRRAWRVLTFWCRRKRHRVPRRVFRNLKRGESG